VQAILLKIYIFKGFAVFFTQNPQKIDFSN
jgi:hypothetical protein